jgi:hypothetical protein
MPDFKGPAENLCKHCTDEKGNLKPREEIQTGIAQWFKSWQPEPWLPSKAYRLSHRRD